MKRFEFPDSLDDLEEIRKDFGGSANVDCDSKPKGDGILKKPTEVMLDAAVTPSREPAKSTRSID